jgi:hypothetical protein
MAQIRTRKEMFPLAESWLKSGMTQKEFSQKHALPQHILPYWVSRYRKAQPRQIDAPSTPNETPAFIRLAASAPVTNADVATKGMEVVMPSGVVLRFSSLIPLSYLKELIGLCSV